MTSNERNLVFIARLCPYLSSLRNKSMVPDFTISSRSVTNIYGSWPKILEPATSLWTLQNEWTLWWNLVWVIQANDTELFICIVYSANFALTFYEWNSMAFKLTAWELQTRSKMRSSRILKLIKIRLTFYVI